MPVDQYCGGAEHTVMHLLYSRFITKVLFDQKLINFDEPFTKLNHQGMILAEDGSKMSKSKGNSVTPDNYIKKYGADVFRTFVLFLAPFEDGGSWSDKGIIGVKRFLDRVWKLQARLGFKTQPNSDKKNVSFKTQHNEDKNLEKVFHQTIKKVTEDIENFHFNTAISQMMILVNEIESSFAKATADKKQKNISEDIYKNLILLLSPFAPHLTEEIWQKLGRKQSLIYEKWPEFDENLIQENEIELVAQVNGKVRDKIIVLANISEDEAKNKALDSEKVQKWLENKEPKKIIYIKSKLISIVV